MDKDKINQPEGGERVLQVDIIQPSEQETF